MSFRQKTKQFIPFALIAIILTISLVSGLTIRVNAVSPSWHSGGYAYNLSPSGTMTATVGPLSVTAGDLIAVWIIVVGTISSVSSVSVSDGVNSYPAISAVNLAGSGTYYSGISTTTATTTTTLSVVGSETSAGGNANTITVYVAVITGASSIITVGSVCAVNGCAILPSASLGNITIPSNSVTVAMFGTQGGSGCPCNHGVIYPSGSFVSLTYNCGYGCAEGYSNSVNGLTSMFATWFGGASTWVGQVLIFTSTPAAPTGCAVYACSTETNTYTTTSKTVINGTTYTMTGTTINYTTHTAVSTSFITATTTQTNTVVRVNNPNMSQSQFWFLPMLFMLIPAATLPGAFMEYEQKRHAPINFDIAIFLFLIGLDIGTIFGIMAKIMPFGILVLVIAMTIADFFFRRGSIF